MHSMKVQQLVGRLTRDGGSSDDELARFDRTLAEHLTAHPNLKSCRRNRRASIR
jgi:hypothetical protein